MSRPYVLLSCAVSRDGYLDDASPQRLILSNVADLRRVDAERAEAGAILVGANTVRRDDPRLLVRDHAHRRPGRPMKVCLTGSGDLDPAARFFTEGDVRKIVYCRPELAAMLGDTLPAATVAGVAAGPDGRVDLAVVLDDLATRGVARLMVEGGASVLEQFLAAGLADEFQLVVSPVVVADERAPRLINAGTTHPAFDELELVEERPIGDVVLLRYRRRRNPAVAVGAGG